MHGTDLTKRSSLRGFRWTICGLVFAATTINYMDRQVLGLLAPVLEKELAWTEMEYARIVMAFQAAYAVGLLGFGRLVDRIGTRHGYAVSIVSWSIAAAAHALARGVWGFGVARFALGLGEAGNFPAAVKAVTEWFPRRERALATGLFNSPAVVGQAGVLGEVRSPASPARKSRAKLQPSVPLVRANWFLRAG